MWGRQLALTIHIRTPRLCNPGCRSLTQVLGLTQQAWLVAELASHVLQHLGVVQNHTLQAHPLLHRVPCTRAFLLTSCPETLHTHRTLLGWTGQKVVLSTSNLPRLTSFPTVHPTIRPSPYICISQLERTCLCVFITHSADKTGVWSGL